MLIDKNVIKKNITYTRLQTMQKKECMKCKEKCNKEFEKMVVNAFWYCGKKYTYLQAYRNIFND